MTISAKHMSSGGGEDGKPLPFSGSDPITKPHRTLHLLLAAQSIVIVLLSINRLSSLTTGYLASNEFLRWVDFNNMLPLPIASLTAFWFTRHWLEYDGPQRNRTPHVLMTLLFVLGAYVTGAGYGNHEVTNYLHARVCLANTDVLCQIIVFNDDEFSHWVFFAGFVMTSLAMVGFGLLFPQRSLRGSNLALVAINGVFIGLGLFANLAFEEIGLDLYVVALLAIASVVALRWKGAQPMSIYFSVAYVFGLIGTGIVKLFFPN